MSLEVAFNEDTSAVYRLYRSGTSQGNNACAMGRHNLQGAQQSETGECYKQISYGY